jgi:hypothetical protein
MQPQAGLAIPAGTPIVLDVDEPTTYAAHGESVRPGRVVDYQTETNASGHPCQVLFIQLDLPLGAISGKASNRVALTERFARFRFNQLLEGLGVPVNIVLDEDGPPPPVTGNYGSPLYVGYGAVSLLGAKKPL